MSGDKNSASLVEPSGIRDEKGGFVNEGFAMTEKNASDKVPMCSFLISFWLYTGRLILSYVNFKTIIFLEFSSIVITNLC